MYSEFLAEVFYLAEIVRGGKHSSDDESITIRDVTGTADNSSSDDDTTNIGRLANLPQIIQLIIRTRHMIMNRLMLYAITSGQKLLTTEPRTCTLCGATEGEALGHKWKMLRALNLKNALYAVTEGEATGHQWKEATCTDPRTCTLCGATEGESSRTQMGA